MVSTCCTATVCFFSAGGDPFCLRFLNIVSMSRLTSAQVIGLGEYLEPDFEPTTLTVSQLLGVLGYHNIRYPTPYSKPKLVQLFNEEIKTRASKFKKERLKKENSIASDDGILDGVTGQPLGATRKTLPARRSSRRFSQAPVDAPQQPPDPPKRRPSSAQPILGGSTRPLAVTQPPLFEESEPEDELPAKKVGRSKKATDSAGTQARRVSNADDSGWEDNNIFQSGAESSSPIRPSPARPRKSALPRRGRKSMSAPPQLLDSPSPSRPIRSQDNTPSSPFSPPLTSFKPVLPSIASQELEVPSFTSVNKAVKAEDLVEDNGDDVTSELPTEQQDNGIEALPVSNDQSVADEVLAISQRIAEGGASNSPQLANGPGALQIFSRLLILLSSLVIMYATLGYKMESAELGYCDAGSNTNSFVEELKANRLAAELCNRENGTYLHPPGHDENGEATSLVPCPLPPLVPLPHPETCTSCPEHAICDRHSVTCDKGHLLRAHALFFNLPAPHQPSNASFSSSLSPSDVIWKVISYSLDGLPGFGSVAFPPKCVEDPRRKRHIGALGKAIEVVLGQERGRRVCFDGKTAVDIVKEEDGGDAKKWGIEIGELKELIKAKTKPHLLPTFADTFNEAVQQLIQWGGVVIGEDKDSHRYLAHKTPDLSWVCLMKVRSREFWEVWRATVLGTFIMILILIVARVRSAQKEVERRRVSDLVQIALDTLRNQELAHHTDPIVAPQPYLSSIQLRDLILQEEHSISTRRRLWNEVERVVEGNANVRANLEEIEGGDELRVWRWVGSAGRGPRSPRKEMEIKDERYVTD